MLPRPGLGCRLVPPAELTPCVQWALPRCRPDRASWILSQVTERVQAGRGAEIVAGTASWASDTGTAPLLAVAMVVEQAAGAATLLLLQTVSAQELQRVVAAQRQVGGPFAQAPAGAASAAAISDPQHLIQPLFEPVLQRLRAQGVSFLQAACDEPSQAGLLQAAGFEPLADLALMVLPAAEFAGLNGCAAAEAASPVPPAGLQWIALEAIGDDWEDLFSAVAADTFIETADCPRLSEFRTAEEIVAGYRTAPSFDRRLSRLLRVDDQWAGCLVLTRNETRGQGELGEQASVALELTYMGLKPECRGRRLAACLLAETVRVATHLGASQIVLAVDVENLAARASYWRFGWRDVAHERVWGRQV